MSIDDHGLEALRKSAHLVDLNNKSETYLLTKLLGAVEGSFAPSGLSIRMKITNLQVGDTAMPMPAAALTDRNSIIIQNRSATSSIFVGESDVEASGIKEGWEVDAGSFFSTDVTDDIIIYAIAPTGETIDVKVMELA